MQAEPLPFSELFHQKNSFMSTDSCPVCMEKFDKMHFYGNVYNEEDEFLIETIIAGQESFCTVEESAVLGKCKLESCQHSLCYSCIFKMSTKYPANDLVCVICRTPIRQVQVENLKGEIFYRDILQDMATARLKSEEYLLTGILMLAVFIVQQLVFMEQSKTQIFTVFDF